jgi:hypothetical protein
MTRVIETKAETSITKRLLRTMEMRTFRGAPLATRRDRIRNEDIRNSCEIQDGLKSEDEHGETV